jgi:hypothetical protein
MLAKEESVCSSSRMTLLHSKQIKELKDTLDRKTLILREARMISQKLQYDLSAIKLESTIRKSIKEM